MTRYTVLARPGSRRPGVEPGPDGTLVVRVAARAVDGAANEAVVAAIAAHLGVPRSAVAIVHGGRGRRKLVDVAD